mmetsp:Transcript_21519/g.33168  ORF Transcript_21519/g.33168 Transcript_21519/m.33168 type:complete len:244 (+) Transcript_21519:329-1060(+)|eukprot:CAMPEP_0195330266 /NCGR_PEP_ID=MMETSP0708-20121125/11936_1 /TAXON_ID=33640 /ORGANISM="Asterionellopsis glacialis, Strain CCMP134" /LENGTH=243 /DNA_ID=CAMNT_0040398513 /DNA_START=141 /DNA_END=872 /DNA_ORIENTATION=-
MNIFSPLSITALLYCLNGSQAWMVSSPPLSSSITRNSFVVPTSTSLCMSSSTQENSSSSSSSSASNLAENRYADDEEEWEYVEVEALTEADFVGSEWLVGTNWNNNPSQIKETWCRLVTTEDGTNLAVWGDKAEGKWNLEVGSQFLSISKETWGGWGGKKIWAGVVDDYYFLQGTVRGWSFTSPAEVLGGWQGKRLGVDPEEAGVAPWFLESSSENDESSTTTTNGEPSLLEQAEEEGGIFGN